MKKLFLAATLLLTISMSIFAQDKEPASQIWNHGDNVSNITYQNVNVYKVLDGPDAYVVLYEQHGVKVGQAVIPKAWTKGVPKKLFFREMPKGLNPYMTIIQQNGEFLKVWLTIPSDRNNSIWGVVENGTTLEGSDATSLKLEY